MLKCLKRTIYANVICVLHKYRFSLQPCFKQPNDVARLHVGLNSLTFKETRNCKHTHTHSRHDNGNNRWQILAHKWVNLNSRHHKTSR